MICEREKVTKRIFLYQETLFAKLGKASFSICEAMPIFEIMLDMVGKTRVIVIYLEALFASQYLGGTF